MSFSDDTLRAYLDGALDDSTRQALELAMRQDPALAGRVRLQQAQRGNLFAGGGESGPARAQAAPRSAKVVQLNAVRALRAGAVPPAAGRRWSWPEWSALAGALVAGLLAGAGIVEALRRDGLATVDGEGGVMTARGALATALNRQLAGGAPSDAPVRIGLSFVARDGAYCRSFRLANGGGLACRGGAAWNVVLFARMDGASNEYHAAGEGMPAAVRDAVARRSVGGALDPAAEKAARDKGWKR